MCVSNTLRYSLVSVNIYNSFYLAITLYFTLVLWCNSIMMDNCQLLNSKWQASRPMLLSWIPRWKIWSLLTWKAFAPKSRKLLAETTLAHIKHKKEELDNAIGAKIEAAQDFEEEITNTDTYQMILDEHIVLLTEFICKASLPPMELEHSPLSVSAPILPHPCSHHQRQAAGLTYPLPSQ